MQMLNIEIYFKDTLKDSIVDLLLGNGYGDFFYIPCAKYTSSCSLLQSALEQVSGRQEFGLFRIFTGESEGKIIIDKLKQDFQGQDIRIFTNFITMYS